VAAQDDDADLELPVDPSDPAEMRSSRRRRSGGASAVPDMSAFAYDPYRNMGGGGGDDGEM
jgi:hypothetical protein